MYTSKYEKEQPAAGVAAAGHLSVFFTSVEEACPPHALTQLRLARSHARTTRTRNETETDFPVGVIFQIIPPNLRFSYVPVRVLSSEVIN